MKDYLAYVLAASLAGGLATRAAAVLIPGGGSPKSDCFVEFDVGSAQATTRGARTKIDCTECDPKCDSDPNNDNHCVFKFQLCPKQSNVPMCKADTPLRPIKVSGASAVGAVVDQNGSKCAMYTADVRLRKRGQRVRASSKTVKVKALSAGRPRLSDQDQLIYNCQPRTSGTCPTTTTTTTTTTTSTVTTTTGVCVMCNTGAACPDTSCGAQEIVTQSTGHCSNNTALKCLQNSTCGMGNTCLTDGTLKVSTLPAFSFPLGVTTTIDIGPPLANCAHQAIVPAGGFMVPHFDLTTLNFCSKVETLHCESGGADGNGMVWDGHSPCPDADVILKGDTSDGVCNPAGQPCNTGPGGAGNNTLGDIDAQLGDACRDALGVHTQLAIPVKSTTWSDSVCSPFSSPGCCITSDYNAADGDGLITQFDFILRPTTSGTSAQFFDKNGDGCSRAGTGPQGPITDTGTPAAGPCCVVGQDTSVVSSGVAFSGGAPNFDLLFISKIPTRITACNPAPTLGSCVLTTNACKQ